MSLFLLFERRAPQPWRQSLVQQLHWDLANARQIALLPDELHLIGYGSRDFRSGLSTQRPTEVIYFIAGSARRNWLMRQEIHTDELTNRNRRLELVMADVEHLVVDRLDQNGREQPIPKTIGPVPRRFRLRLIASGQAVPIVDETLYIRWEP